MEGKDYWDELQKDNCSIKVKKKASAMLTCALGDYALRVCSSQITEPMKMLGLLDKRYASTRTATRISVLTSVYKKSFGQKDSMPRYIDEFESLFAQLERMGEDAAIPESHKAILLLASLTHYSSLKSTVAALRLKNVEDITWETVSADLIQERKQVNVGPTSHQKIAKARRDSSEYEERHSRSRTMKPRRHAKSAKGDLQWAFCGKNGHTQHDCFLNPDSPECRLPEQAKRNLKSKRAGSLKKKSEKTINFGLKVRVGKLRAKSTRASQHDPPVLDSGASTTMFRDENEVIDGTYVGDSQEKLTLAAGGKSVKYNGQATIGVGGLNLPSSLHVQQLHGTLVSVGHVCDQSKMVMFTNKEAIIMKKKPFEVLENDVHLIIKRNFDTGLYELDDNYFENTQRDHRALSTKQEELQLWHNR